MSFCWILNLPPQEIFQVLESSKTVYDLKKIKPDTTITLDIDSNSNSLNRLVYNYDDEHLLVVHKTAEGYSTSKEKILYDISLRTIQGTIKNNLFDDAIEAGGNPQIILNFADILAWDVDFFTDLRQNDSFKILFEEVCKDGEFVKCGKILAAEFVNNGRQIRVFYFEDDQGNAGYYDDQGKIRGQGVSQVTPEIQPHQLRVHQKALSPHPQNLSSPPGGRLRSSRRHPY